MEILAKDIKGDVIEFEEIPDEDLWEDGELSPGEVHYKIIKHVIQLGDWKLIRRVK